MPALLQSGFTTEISALFSDDYLVKQYTSGKKNLIAVAESFCRRIVNLLRASRFDLIVIEYELFPYFPALFERLFNWFKVPYIVDYDDAIYHQYASHGNLIVRTFLGEKIASVMRNAELVIVGNQYLADYALRSSAQKVEILPTVVDLNLYPTLKKNAGTLDNFTVGWIGSPSTSKYLGEITPALTEFCGKGGYRVRLIGASKEIIPNVAAEVFFWSEQTEVELLQSYDVGIMPLPDEPWTRGKCGLKLIQYMACGLPVVASPVGVNKDIVEHGVNGFLASTNKEWIQALETLRKDPKLRRRMGESGRRKVEEKYCLQVTAPCYVELLKSILERRY
jgi:glycosyltransferase involved in cell wall biosynthesis